MVAHSRIKPRLLHGGSWQNRTPISSLALVSSIISRKHGCIRKRSSAGRMMESAGRFRIVGDRVACYFETLAMSLDADRGAKGCGRRRVSGARGRYGGVHAQ